MEKKDLKTTNSETVQKDESTTQFGDNQLPPLTDVESAQLSAELAKEEEYGNRPIAAGLAGAARGASFGLSDVALTKSGLVDPSTLRELEERNKAASLVGEAAGIVGPLLTPAGLLGAGVKGAATAAKAVESISAKALQRIIADTGKKKLATEIIAKSIPKAAGSAVEGAFYGVGDLISEEALGRADINAESLVASAGTGALFGGTIGGVLGTASALSPVIKNNKVVDFVVEKVKPKNTAISAWELAGKSASDIQKLKSKNLSIYDNLVPYIQDRKLLNILDSTDDLISKVTDDIEKLGSEIGETLNKIDTTVAPELMPTKHQLGKSIVNRLEDLKVELASTPLEESQSIIRRIDKDINNINKNFTNAKGSLTGTELQNLKVQFQKQANWARKGQLPVAEQIARESSRALRDELLNLAERATVADINLATTLKQQNLNYGTAQEFLKSLENKNIKEAGKSLLSLKEGILGGIGASISPELGAATIAAKKFLESDFKRKLMIMTDIESGIQKVSKAITNSSNKFIDKYSPTVVPATTSALMASDIAKKDNKKPKTKVEALNNIIDNLEALKSNPTKLVDDIALHTQSISSAAPNTAAQTSFVLNQAVDFLASKAPKRAEKPGMVQLARKLLLPSTQELSKFERYLNAVERPIETIKSLESGTFSTEAAEALKAVYPGLYGNLQQEVLKKAQDNADKLTYNQRLQLGILLDIPADSSLSPDLLLNLQKQFGEQSQAREAQIAETRAALNTTVGGVKGIEMPDRLLTPTQSTATRRK